MKNTQISKEDRIMLIKQWNEKRDKVIKARICSSSFHKWIIRIEKEKEILDKKNLAEEFEKNLVILGKLDSFVIEKARNWINAHDSWNSLFHCWSWRGVLFGSDYPVLSSYSQELEQFIKKLEEGTEFEGEFDRELTEFSQKDSKEFEKYERKQEEIFAAHELNCRLWMGKWS